MKHKFEFSQVATKGMFTGTQVIFRALWYEIITDQGTYGIFYGFGKFPYVFEGFYKTQGAIYAVRIYTVAQELICCDLAMTRHIYAGSLNKSYRNFEIVFVQQNVLPMLNSTHSSYTTTCLM